MTKNIEIFARKTKKGVVILLCCICIFATVACGKKKEDINQDPLGQTAVNEMGEEKSGKLSEASKLSADADIELVSEDTTYFKVRQLDSVFEKGENQTSYVLNIVASESGAAVQVNINDVPENWEDEVISHDVIFMLNDQGEVTNEFRVQEIIPDDIGGLRSMQMDKDGNLILVVNPPFDESNPVSSTWIYKVSVQGEILGGKIALKPSDNKGLRTSYSAVLLDQQNRIFASGFAERGASRPSSFVTVFDEDGNELFVLEDESSNPQDAWSFGYEMCTDGSQIYIEVNPDFVNDQTEYYRQIRPIDTANQTIGDALEGAGSGLNFTSVQSGSDGLYYSDYVGVYRIHPEENRTETIFLWKDIDADFASGVTEHVVVLSENKILVNRGETENYISRWYMMERQDSNPNAGKKILRIGGVGIAGSERLTRAVYLFNQSSEDTRAELLDYTASAGESALFTDQMKSMNMAILSGDVPDILYGVEQIPMYADKNLFLDLKEMINNDDSFDVSDFYENILFSTEKDGQMYYMFSSFSIPTYHGEKELLGDKKSWTIDELTAFAETLPEDIQLFSNMQSQESLLSAILRTSLDTFMNKKEKTVRFDSPEFQRALEFVKSNGISRAQEQSFFESGMDMQPSPSVLDSVSISSFRDFNWITSDTIFIGYPTFEENKIFCYPDETVSIFESTPQKSEAWEFLKLLVSEELYEEDMLGSSYMHSMPVRKSAFEKVVAKEKQDLTELAEWQAQLVEDGASRTPDMISKDMFDTSYDQIKELVSRVNGVIYIDWEIWSIVDEETQAFFAGQKTAEDVARIIQQRVTTLVNER